MSRNNYKFENSDFFIRAFEAANKYAIDEKFDLDPYKSDICYAFLSGVRWYQEQIKIFVCAQNKQLNLFNDD